MWSRKDRNTADDSWVWLATLGRDLGPGQGLNGESHFAKISLLESEASGLLLGSLAFHGEIGGTLEAHGHCHQEHLSVS